MLLAVDVWSYSSRCRCYLLSMRWFSLEEERVMQQSSISISLSFLEPKYQSSRILHASPSYLHKKQEPRNQRDKGVVNLFKVTYESEI